jgi:hypothetical protein
MKSSQNHAADPSEGQRRTQCHGQLDLTAEPRRVRREACFCGPERLLRLDEARGAGPCLAAPRPGSQRGPGQALHAGPLRGSLGEGSGLAAGGALGRCSLSSFCSVVNSDGGADASADRLSHRREELRQVCRRSPRAPAPAEPARAHRHGPGGPPPHPADVVLRAAVGPAAAWDADKHEEGSARSLLRRAGAARRPPPAATCRSPRVIAAARRAGPLCARRSATGRPQCARRRRRRAAAAARRGRRAGPAAAVRLGLGPTRDPGPALPRVGR